MPSLTSEDIRRQIAEQENTRANALRELDDLAAHRRSLLLGPADRAGDKALSEHDVAVQRASRTIDRADAHIAELRPALERAEVAERNATIAELSQHGADLLAAYEEVARREYEPAARALAAIMAKLDNLRFDVERVSAALPTGRRSLQVEAWRRQEGNPWRLPSLPEQVRLPALLQGAEAIWDADARKPSVPQPVLSPLRPQPEPARQPPDIRVERPGWDQRMREIERRSELERRERRGSLFEIGQPTVL